MCYQSKFSFVFELNSKNETIRFNSTNVSVQRMVCGSQIDIAAIGHTAIRALKAIRQNGRGRELSTFVVVGCTDVPIMVALSDVSASKNRNKVDKFGKYAKFLFLSLQ